ncbi:hypothetical protein D3C72_455300 [compost metagenome]
MLGDVVDVGALGQALEHREFALRKQRMQRPRIGQADFEDHAIRQIRINVTPTGRDLANGGEQQRRITVLGRIPGSANLQRPSSHLRFVMHRQYQNRWRIVQSTDARDRFEAIDAGHGDVEQHHFARHIAQGFEQLLTIARLAHHLQILGQANQLLDAFADNGVVFGYQYSDQIFSPDFRYTPIPVGASLLAIASAQTPQTFKPHSPAPAPPDWCPPPAHSPASAARP